MVHPCLQRCVRSVFQLFAEVRPWKQMAPKIVSFENAYRPRKGEEEKIPHSFLFRRRDCFLTALHFQSIVFVMSSSVASSLPCATGLPGNLAKSERLPRRYQQNHCDVFALVKHQLADDDLCQDPLLVFPGDEAPAVKNFWKCAVKHRGERNPSGT